MKYKINLFPPKERNSVDKIIYFSFHYLRYILVITQLVVIFVFFFRFKVDQEIVDLKDTLRQKEEIVTVASALMKEARAVEYKVKAVDSVLTEQVRDSGAFSYIVTVFPAELSLTKFRIDGNTVSLEGSTSNANTVRMFYQRLKSDGRFQIVQLVNVKKSDTSFTFLIEMKDFIPQ